VRQHVSLSNYEAFCLYLDYGRVEADNPQFENIRNE